MAQAPTLAPPQPEPRIAMTYEEWLAWPDSNTKRTEWVDGEAIVFMPTKTVHALMSIFVARLLGDYVDPFDLGLVIHSPFEMRLERSAREPDILFVAAVHLDRLTPERLIGPADLAVEIISDDSTTRDRVDKHREYAEAGVPEYWLFDPRPGHHRADFFGLTADGAYEPLPPDAAGRVHSRVLPRFWLDPAWLWREPLPKPAALLALIVPAGR